MKSSIKQISKLFWSIVLLVAATACSDDQTSDMRLDGETWITDFALDNFNGTIDRTDRTITVEVPVKYDTEAMTVTSLKVSEGAEASVKEGDKLNCSVTQMIRVSNGDTYLDYILQIKHDEAQILSFKLNDTYTGVIDQTEKSITVHVPTSVDITNLVPTIVTSEGAIVYPESGRALDFTHPVDFTVAYNTASSLYTVTVTQSDSPDAVYVGLANSIDGLNAEEKEAATWMLNNIANSQYVSFTEVETGNVNLSRCKVIWWHLHIDGGIDNMSKFENEAQAAVGIRIVDKMKALYEGGTNFLLTRYATYYAVKLGATRDGKNPNNCWGQNETSPEITTNAWSFFAKEHYTHPIYQGVVESDADHSVYTCDTGYGITNSTAQWHIGSDWGDYPDYDTWRNNHGGTDLGYGGDGAIVAWEYPAANGKGGIVCIGSGCYDWYSYGTDASSDRYHGNVGKMTQNAIEYLMSNNQ